MSVSFTWLSQGCFMTLHTDLLYGRDSVWTEFSLESSDGIGTLVGSRFVRFDLHHLHQCRK
jgi:hypothetical protein